MFVMFCVIVMVLILRFGTLALLKSGHLSEETTEDDFFFWVGCFGCLVISPVVIPIFFVVFLMWVFWQFLNGNIVTRFTQISAWIKKTYGKA